MRIQLKTQTYTKVCNDSLTEVVAILGATGEVRKELRKYFIKKGTFLGLKSIGGIVEVNEFIEKEEVKPATMQEETIQIPTIKEVMMTLPSVQTTGTKPSTAVLPKGNSTYQKQERVKEQVSSDILTITKALVIKSEGNDSLTWVQFDYGMMRKVTGLIGRSEYKGRINVRFIPSKNKKEKFCFVVDRKLGESIIIKTREWIKANIERAYPKAA